MHSYIYMHVLLLLVVVFFVIIIIGVLIIIRPTLYIINSKYLHLYMHTEFCSSVWYREDIRTYKVKFSVEVIKFLYNLDIVTLPLDI